MGMFDLVVDKTTGVPPNQFKYEYVIVIFSSIRTPGGSRELSSVINCNDDYSKVYHRKQLSRLLTLKHILHMRVLMCLTVSVYQYSTSKCDCVTLRLNTVNGKRGLSFEYRNRIVLYSRNLNNV